MNSSSTRMLWLDLLCVSTFLGSGSGDVSTLALTGGTVLTVQRRACVQCGRTVYECGHTRMIEAARTLGGAEPVEEYLQKLEHSRRKEDAQRLADMAIVFEEYGQRGTLRIPRELNQLRDELWEIKVGDIRFPFYEVTDEKHSATVARLTGCFPKQTLRTPRREIDKALWVMGEDRQS
jgi:hypothetical protein